MKITKNFLALTILIVSLSTHAEKLPNNSQEKIAHQKYEFSLPENERVKLLKNIQLIHIGTSIENVKKILGEPTLEEEMIGKKGEFIAYALSYYLSRISMETVNVNDEVIDFYFNKNRLLTKISRHCTCN